MFPITYYMLACTMVLTTVICEDEYKFFPVWGIGHQCMDRGPYAGACNSQNVHDGELICSRLACAVPRSGGSYIVRYTERVDDGTPCGQKRVCNEGECVFAPPSELEPILDNGTMVDCISQSTATVRRYFPRTFAKHRLAQLKRGHPSWLTHLTSKRGN